MTAAVDDADAALRVKDLERLRQAMTDLDDKMDNHLAFASKSATRQYAESVGLALGMAEEVSCRHPGRRRALE